MEEVQDLCECEWPLSWMGRSRKRALSVEETELELELCDEPGRWVKRECWSREAVDVCRREAPPAQTIETRLGGLAGWLVKRLAS